MVGETYKQARVPATAQRSRTIGLLFTALIIVLATAISAYTQYKSLVKLQDRAAHSQNMLSALENTLSTVKDAETGQRGFLVTGNSQYLEPYKIAQARIRRSMQELSTLASEDAIQHAMVERLPLPIEEKFSEMKQTIVLYRTLGLEAALSLVKDNSGHRFMEEIRSGIAAMQLHELASMQAITAQITAETQAFTITCLVLTGLLIGLFLTLGYFMRGYRQETKTSNAKLLQRTEELATSNKDLEERTRELATSNVELEARVQARTSELNLLNKELFAAKDVAQEASKLKSDFVATMSHEIRTPMNAVIGMSNVLLKTDLNKQQLHYANSIKQAGNSLLAVINDILDFSKIEAGKLELELSDFDPVWLVEGVSELFALQARSKNISLMTFIDGAVPARLRGDPDRLRQILTNLVGNAIKFCQQGEVVIRADVESTNGDIARVRFAVQDQGIGLSFEQQGRLFQPFVQADGSITRKYGGTGLGLSICKSLVELMNGSISVESNEGKGSTFSFVIPLERRSNESSSTDIADLANVRVLVVDDEPSTREILHSYVVSWGMRNGSARSTKDALVMLRQAYADGDPYKIAIVDLVMPESDGILLAQEVAADPSIKNTALLLVTAFDTFGLGTLAIDVGFKGYFTKPVKQAEMRDCLIKVMRGEQPGIAESAADKKLKAAPLAPSITKAGFVLVAEDHPINQQVAQLYLDELGLACQVVNNGREAVAASDNRAYSLLLMDCQMPEMDGFEASMAIRKNEQLSGRHIPIIAMTANAVQGDKERCLAAGMDDYLSKPVEPHQLKDMLEKWMPTEEPGKQPLKDGALRTDGGKPATFGHHVFDVEHLSQRFSAKAVRDLLSLFLTQMPSDLEKLKLAVKSSDSESVERTAHSLRGVFCVIGVENMTELCLLLEQEVRDSRWDLTRGTLINFERQLKPLIADVTKEVALLSA